MNGVKFYGDRSPETIIAYAASLMRVNGGNLAPIFEQLLSNRNGVRYAAENVRFYGNGGIGGEINGEPVLMGTMDFLKDMGVEIPDGTMVKQAVYVSVDGDLSGLFAITYNRSRHSAAGMATLCSSRRIRPVIIAKDFVLTAPFLKEMFGLRPKRTAFPSRTESIALEAIQADPKPPLWR
jgi:cation transport ATPase